MVLLAEDGTRLAGRYGYLGTQTNNQAEYLALIEGLRLAAEWRPEHLTVRMDSQLVVEQMSGRYRVKDAKLRPLFERARALATSFPSIEFVHVDRGLNRAADALANKAIDDHLAGRAE